MKHNRSTLVLSLYLVLFFVPLSLVHAQSPETAGSFTHAKLTVHDLQPLSTVDDDDSLRTKEEIEAEIQRLERKIEILQVELATATEEEEKQITLQISDLESRVIELRQRLEGEQPREDEWDFEGYGQGEESEWEKEAGDSEFEEWTDIESEFFRKYPAVFSWPFPMETEFAKSFIRYNRVEGFYLGVAHTKRLNWHSKKSIVTTFSLGYGFASMKGRYSAGLYFPFYFDDQIVEVGGEGHLFTDSKDQWTIDADENSAMAFFAKEDFMDYFQRGGFSVSASWYYRTSNEQTWRLTGRYLHDTYKEMGRETDWALFGGDKSFRENPIQNNHLYHRAIAGNLNSMVFGFGWSTTASDSRNHGWKMNLTFETAGSFMDGDYEFNQLVADARRYQPLGEHLNFNSRIRFGGTDGAVPFQRMFDMGGIGTLPGYRFKLFSGTHAGLLNTELIIKSSIAGASDGWFKRFMQSVNLIVFYDVGTVVMNYGDNPELDGNGNYSSPPHPDSIIDGLSDLTEAQWLSSLGVAFGSEDGSYRIGVAWPMTGRDKEPALVVRLASPF